MGPPVAQMSATFDRVQRDVDFGARAGADDFALVEELGVVRFAFADNDLAVHGDRVERLAHRVARRPIRHAVVALADETRSRQRRGFGRAHHFKGKIPLHSRLRSVRGENQVSRPNKDSIR